MTNLLKIFGQNFIAIVRAWSALPSLSNVIVINPFEVATGKEDEAVAIWDKFAAHFRAQPGYVTSKLYQAADDDSRFHLVTVSEWESISHFQAALAGCRRKEISTQISQINADFSQKLVSSQ